MTDSDLAIPSKHPLTHSICSLNQERDRDSYNSVYPNQPLLLSRQRGRVVRASDLQSSSLGFKPHSDHYLDLFHGSPEFKSSPTLVNSQLVCLRPVGILNNVMFNLNCFSCLLGPTSLCAKTLRRVNKGIIIFYNIRKLHAFLLM